MHLVLNLPLDGIVGQVAQAARRLTTAGRPGVDPGCRRGGEFFHFFMSRLVLGSTKPPIKCVPGFSPVIKTAEHGTIQPTSS